MKGFLAFSLEVALIPLREEGLDKGFADAEGGRYYAKFARDSEDDVWW